MVASPGTSIAVRARMVRRGLVVVVIIVIGLASAAAHAERAGVELQGAVTGTASAGAEYRGTLGPGVRLALTGGRAWTGGVRLAVWSGSYDWTSPDPMVYVAPDA